MASWDRQQLVEVRPGKTDHCIALSWARMLIAQHAVTMDGFWTHWVILRIVPNDSVSGVQRRCLPQHTCVLMPASPKLESFVTWTKRPGDPWDSRLSSDDPSSVQIALTPKPKLFPRPCLAVPSRSPAEPGMPHGPASLHPSGTAAS